MSDDATAPPPTSVSALHGHSQWGDAVAPTSHDTAGSDVGAYCRRWMAAERELERLDRRWALIDGRILKRGKVRPLGHSGVGTLAEQAEMAALQRRLAILSAEQTSGLERLAGVTPKDLSEAAALMTVAAHLLRYEGEAPYKLICAALDAVQAETLAASVCT